MRPHNDFLHFSVKIISLIMIRREFQNCQLLTSLKNIKLRFAFILLIIPAISFGQSKMVCEQEYNGRIFYSSRPKEVTSISQLPVTIQKNLKGYLKQALGAIYDSIDFSHGQIVNLRKNFKHDTEAYRREWLAAKYELNFVIHDMSIGIKSYYLSVRLDEYGEIIESNWPRHFFSNRQELGRLQEIETKAINTALRKKFDTLNYSVILEYDHKQDRLYWCFYFIRESRNLKKSYNVILIDWKSHEIINDTQIRETDVVY